MNISFPVSWLKEYLKSDVATKTLANLLSLSGPSIEKIEKVDRDFIIDVEVTSNRPDASSVFGLAREAHAILSYNKIHSKLKEPEGYDTKLLLDVTKPLKLDVIIRNSKLCHRFTAIVVDDVKIGPSPAYVKNRLEASGIRSINNIVDITNYVMLETGQPLHAFDFDKIEGAQMTLRASKNGERIITLDDKKHQLPENAIIIEDAKKIIDLCGIMGGANSQITRRTKKVILFAQSYNPHNIRKTTQALAIRTEAAARFEKGVDVENILNVLKRAVYLAKQNAQAKIASELIDIQKPNRKITEEISLKMEKLCNYLGVDIKAEKAKNILELLGFKSKTNGATIFATPPHWRSEDVKADVDLIEEIARIYGYHNIPSSLPIGVVPIELKTELENAIELKKALKYFGLSEVITYSIISKKLGSQSDTKISNLVELSNPLTQEWQFMRPQILPSLLGIVAKNQFIKEKIHIFEIARTYIAQKKDLPTQDLYLSFVLTEIDFFEIKGLLENIFETLGRNVTFEKPRGEKKLLLRSQSAVILSEGKDVGFVGMINPTAMDFFGVEREMFAAEINLTTIYSLNTKNKTFKPISKYPPQIEDISAIFGTSTDLTEITKSIKQASDLVKNVEIIDVYKGKSIPEGKKSVTVRITYQKTSGTPTINDVEKARGKISHELTSTFHAQIRK